MQILDQKIAQETHNLRHITIHDKTALIPQKRTKMLLLQGNKYSDIITVILAVCIGSVLKSSTMLLAQYNLLTAGLMLFSTVLIAQCLSHSAYSKVLYSTALF